MSFITHAERTDGRIILGFHGTGGDELQMLGIVRAIDPNAAYFSPRGKALEGGVHARYFRRFEEGVLDIPDLMEKAAELAEWLPGALEKLDMDSRPRTSVGYSNGATISSALLLLYPDLLDQVILLRPMVPFVPEVAPDLTGRRVLICASPTDQITPFEGGEELARMLESFGAEVIFAAVPGGHGLGQPDIEAAQNFL
ncbi:MAG: hypothetical protein JNK63_04655 [Chthonomonas sp.]|nr:hypothetical protein [Chthonomonas sp.]